MEDQSPPPRIEFKFEVVRDAKDIILERAMIALTPTQPGEWFTAISLRLYQLINEMFDALQLRQMQTFEDATLELTESIECTKEELKELQKEDWGLATHVAGHSVQEIKEVAKSLYYEKFEIGMHVIGIFRDEFTSDGTYHLERGSYFKFNARGRKTSIRLDALNEVLKRKPMLEEIRLRKQVE